MLTRKGAISSDSSWFKNPSKLLPWELTVTKLLRAKNFQISSLRMHIIRFSACSNSSVIVLASVSVEEVIFFQTHASCRAALALILQTRPSQFGDAKEMGR
jgi:hypothetical protein